MKLFKIMIKLVFILIPLLIIYSIYVEPKLLVVKSFDLPQAGKTQQSIRIVQFTDTQLGQFYSLHQLEAVVERINEQQPDIIVFTGDLIDSVRQYDDTGQVSRVLARLKAARGNFAIYGNHDYGGGAEKYYKDIMEKAGFHVLVNEKLTIKLDDGRRMAFLGLDDVMLGDPQPKQLMAVIDARDYNVLLLHEPDYADKFKGSDIDLVLAGHSHGGQIRLPFIGALVRVPYSMKYNKGFYEINGGKTRLYVNSGIGNTQLPFRFMNMPQIAVFDVKY